MQEEGAMRIATRQLREWSVAVLSAAGLPGGDAAVIAGILVETDMRGVFSHGTRQLGGYVRSFQAGEMNPTPQVRVVQDEATTGVVDGDGGLGFLAAARATELAIAKARAVGVGAVVSRNHGHCGAAGTYTRAAIRQDCIGFCVSGHVVKVPTTDSPRWNVMGNPPMSFGFPSGQESPVVLDMGAVFFEQETFLSLFERIPSAFFKSLGLVWSCHMLGGVLAGMTLPHLETYDGPFNAAGYGVFILALDIGRFLPIEAFETEVDRMVRELRTLPPLPGCSEYVLPGALEWQRERAWAVEGIPLSDDHQRKLEHLGDALGVPVPWW